MHLRDEATLLCKVRRHGQLQIGHFLLQARLLEWIG
jgi:hypothetical protein